MSGRIVPVHHLRQNDKVWTPPCVIIFDTETQVIQQGDPEILGLRLWVASRVDRRHKGKRPVAPLSGTGRTQYELATWIQQACKGRRTVWAYAHNLAFDLTTTRLPDRLVELGWRVTEFAFSGKSPWLRLTNGNTVLTLADSWSWLPQSLNSIAALNGGIKDELPTDNDNSDKWWQRCSHDVVLLARAVLDLMQWWDDNALGRWTITGPSCGWNVMRHRILKGSITVDPDSGGIASDRRAIRGGRRDVTRVGLYDHGPYVAIDFTAAFATVAATLPLPCKRMSNFQSLPLSTNLLGWSRFGIIAECEVETDVPRYPLSVSDVTVYPVGRFRTTLAGPEIEWARANGDLRAIGRGYVHKLSLGLAGWARWILAQSAGGDGSVPPVARAVTKAWGRSVIGKFAAHSGESSKLGPALSPSWSWEDGYDHRRQCRTSTIDFGGDRWLVHHDQDPDNAYPAVLAWVESEVRWRLSCALERLPEGSWLQADTDGVLVDLGALGGHLGARGRRTSLGADPMGQANRLCELLNVGLEPLSFRPKATYDVVEVIGPQHLRLDSETRMSGIRRDAAPVAGGKLEARIWPGLAWQMNEGSEAGYSRPLRTWSVPATTAHRWVGEDGDCYPATAEVTDSGHSAIVSWERSGWERWGVRLQPVQHSCFANLY